jgi:anaerobic selenocysteine-containing dehydrogenase
MVELAPPTMLADLPRLEAAIDEAPDGLLLVGRRHLRTNNSWGQNVAALTGGRDLCTLWMHPDDAAGAGVGDGDTVTVSSRVGAVRAPVEVTDDIAPGTVSLPHGFGNDVEGVRLAVARDVGGVNSNVLTDEQDVDPLSGNAVLNGIPVTVARAA